MAIAFVSRASSPQAGGTTFTTPAHTHAAGNLLALVLQSQLAGASVSSVTNTAGDTWHATTHTPQAGTGQNLQLIYYVNSTLGNASDVVTLVMSGSTNYTTITCYEFSGCDATAPYVADSGASAGSGTAINSGVITLAGSSVIVATYETDGASSTPGPGYTQTTTDTNSVVYDAYHMTATSEAATATAGAGAWVILAAAFKVAGSGGGAVKLPPRAVVIGAGVHA
jgi:hypothetical protein